LARLGLGSVQLSSATLPAGCSEARELSVSRDLKFKGCDYSLDPGEPKPARNRHRWCCAAAAHGNSALYKVGRPRAGAGVMACTGSRPPMLPGPTVTDLSYLSLPNDVTS
jgi:hypothetical protein